MPRHVALLVLVCTAVLGEPRYPYPFGPFSRLAKESEGLLGNGFFVTQVERGFKLHAVIPGPAPDGMYGRLAFATFLTLDTGHPGASAPLFLEFQQPGSGTETLECDEWHAVVGKRSGAWRQTVETWLGYPFVWISADLLGAGARSATWLLTGYAWAGKRPPDTCLLHWPGEAEPRAALLSPDAPAPLPPGQHLGGPLVILRSDGETFQLALVFSQSPLEICRRGEDVAVQVPVADGGAAPVAIGVFPASMTWDDLAALVPLALTRPTAMGRSCHLADGQPVLQLSVAGEGISNEWGVAPAPHVPVPPTLAHRAPKPALRLPSLQGEVALCPGTEISIALEPVAGLDQVGPPLGDMPPQMRDRLNRLALEMAGHLRPQGGFTSSRGRPFYDGLTCSGLLLARPYLDDQAREVVDQAVRRTLDLWWSNLRLDGERGIWYFPEPVPFLPQVDYPEITGTLLWPTAQYVAMVDPGYARQVAAQVRRLAASLPRAYDWTGAAYAHPGPEYTHIITESVTGGLVAWCGLYHLARVLDDHELAGQCAAWASFARESLRLLRWRPEYGDTGVVSELFFDRIKTRITEAWCYTMYTWFSFVPALDLGPVETDPYHLWKTLEQEQWWDYSLQSKQRCYDYAHLMAVARWRGVDEALAVLPVFDHRPYEYEYFDSTPAYTLMAYPWLAGLASAQ